MRNILRLLAATLITISATTLYAQTDSTAVDENIPMADFNNPKKYIINDIKVSGIKYLNADIIAGTSGINKGDTIYIPGDYLSSALRKMWSQRYYSDIKIVTEEIGDDKVNIEIILVERPKVTEWKIEGTTSTETKELFENLKLKKGGELSDYVLTTSQNAIYKYLKERGFRNAKINVIQENDPNASEGNAVKVTFKVNKNERVRIKEIKFDGNDNFSDRRLRRTFKKIHQRGINVFNNTKLKDKEYAEDKENLIDFYNSKGFRNAIVVKDTVYDISSNRIGINITVDEGKKFYFNNITWTGNSVYDTKTLSEVLGIQKGETYDKKTLYKRLGYGKEDNPEDPSTVNSMYKDKGYIFSEIDPAENVVGTDSVDINIKIFEGNPARINDVSITGNYSVNENVIRRELDVRPGDLFDRSLLMSSIRRLAQMQHFDPEKIQPGLVPVSNDKVNLSFPLTERSSDQFQVSGGWGYGMFIGSIGVTLNNVSIKNFFKKNAWTPYPKGQNQQLSINGQTNGTYYKALSLNFVEPWLGGKKPNSLNIGLFYSSQNDAYYAWQTGNSHFRTLGASVGIGRRLSWPDRNFTIYNEISYQAYNLKDWTAFLFQNGMSNIITLKTVFGRNTVDQPIYPRQGSDFSISLTLTPPYSLFQNIDYADPNLPDNVRYKWIEYHKWQIKGQWFYPITNNNKLVLMAKAEMGYIGSYNKNKPSPFEGFDVGGDGMSGYNIYGVDIVGLRGYDNGALTPYSPNGNIYAKAYNKYTVEVRYPILLGQQTIFGLVFAEAGNAFSSWKEFDPFLVKRSLGVGVRLYLPVLGLIGFDWGYGFDKTPDGKGRSGGHPHFVMGMEF